MVARARVEGERAFVLHVTPWRETSLIVELLTVNHGRVAAVAKGAKRANSAMRALQLSFQPLHVSWTGSSELRTLTKAEWQGGLAHPQGEALFCGFYLNELLVRLLHREDPHPLVLTLYQATLEKLTEPQSALEREWTLRQFEWQLLKICGYAPDLKADKMGKLINSEVQYQMVAGEGFVALKTDLSLREADNSFGYAKSETMSLNGRQIEQLSSALNRPTPIPEDEVIQWAKPLMRLLMSVPLEGRPLKTRQILRELQQL